MLLPLLLIANAALTELDAGPFVEALSAPAPDGGFVSLGLRFARPATLVRVDRTGAVRWKREVDVGVPPVYRWIFAQRSGSVLLAGSDDDLVFRQYSPDGARLEFELRYGGPGREAMRAVAVDGDGGVSAFYTVTAADTPPRHFLLRVSPRGQVLGNDPVPEPDQPDGLFAAFSDGAVGRLTRVDGRQALERLPAGPSRPVEIPNGFLPSTLQPTADGGFWLAGFSNLRGLRTTPGAPQPRSGAAPLYRFEAGDVFSTFPENESPRLVVDWREANTLYAGGMDGVWRSGMNGWDWTKLAGSPGNTVDLVQGGGRLWHLAADQSLRWSSDRGATWQRTRLPGQAMALAASMGDDLTLCAWSGNTVFITSDGGEHWRAQNFRQPITGVAVDPRDSRRILVTASNPGGPRFIVAEYRLYLSRDGGESFLERELAGPAANLTMDPFAPGRYVLMLGERLFEGNTADFGAPTGLNSVERPLRVAFHPEQPGVLFMASQTKALMRSEDGGVTWQRWGEAAAPLAALNVGAGGVLHLTPLRTFELMVARVNRDGVLEFLTYLGGADNEVLQSVTALPDGGLVVGGRTSSSDFPVTDGGRGPGAFVVEYDVDGRLRRSSVAPELFSAWAVQAGALVALRDEGLWFARWP